MTFIRNDRSQLLQKRCEWGQEWTLKRPPNSDGLTKTVNTNNEGHTSSLKGNQKLIVTQAELLNTAKFFFLTSSPLGSYHRAKKLFDVFYFHCKPVFIVKDLFIKPFEEKKPKGVFWVIFTR